MKNCQKCGERINDKSKFCSYCGERVKNNLSHTDSLSVAEDESSPAETPTNQVENPIEEKVNMFTAYSKFAVFKGRSTRKELWLFVLFQLFCAIALYLIAFDNNEAYGDLAFVFWVVNFIPCLALLVRRIHDAGFSVIAWLIMLFWILWVVGDYLPLYLNWLVILVLLCLKSEPKTNKYGPYTIAKTGKKQNKNNIDLQLTTN